MFGSLFEDDFDDFYDDEDFSEEIESLMGHQQQPIDLLKGLLGDMTVGQLRQMARRRVWTVKGTRKDDIVQQIAEQMLDSINDPTTFNDLTKNERELLAATNTLFGMSLPIQLEQFQYAWKTVLKKRGSPINTIEGLVTYGVFTKVSDRWDSDFSYYQPMIPFPPHFLPAMPLVAPKLKRSSKPIVPTFPAPSFINQMERIGFYAAAGGYLKPMEKVAEFYPHGHPDNMWIGDWPYLPEDEEKIGRTSYYRYMSQPPIMTVPIRPQSMDQATHNALRDVTHNWDTLDVIVQFLTAQGLFTVDEEKFQYILVADAWQEFIKLAEIEKLQIFFNSWQSGLVDMAELRLFLRENPDLALWRMAHPDLPYQSFLLEFMLARQLIVRLLGGLATAEHQPWYSLRNFSNETRRYRPDLYHMLTSDETWGLKKGDDYLISLEEPKSWENFVTTMIQTHFSGMLHWLGMIDLHVRNGRIEAFRLTPLGCHLLRPIDVPPPKEDSSSGEAEWVDDQTIKITRGRNINELLGLISRIAIPVSGQASSYRIGGPGLEGIFADGETPDTLAMQFANLDYPLPTAVRQHLANVYKQFGRAHLYDELTVIEFSDDTALVELRAAGLLKDMIIYEYSPRLIVIDPEKADKLAKTLEKKGYTPTLTEEAD